MRLRGGGRPLGEAHRPEVASRRELASVGRKARVKVLLVVVCWALMSACAHPPGEVVRAPFLADERFSPPSAAVDVQAALSMSVPMRQYLQSHVLPRVQAKGGAEGLIESLYTKGELRLDYDSTVTRTAAEAFEARSGNCLSLVIMTAAFARELGIPVQFQSVYVESNWTRDGDVYLSSGHVNLVLGRRLIDQRGVAAGDGGLVVDFLPGADLRGQRARVITEDVIVAMYLNNRAAEHLARGLVADAYWWAREALIQSPRYLSAYNTLGVVYLRSGHPDLAEASFRQVLDAEPGNVPALANLAKLLRAEGRDAEASAFERRLAQAEPHPPYFHFDQGMQAVRAGDLAAARDAFRREIERAAYNHEFHFWLGVVSFHLGEHAAARRHLDLAKAYAPTSGDRALYSGKLAWIQAAAQTRTRPLMP